jgi:antitoxin component of MazEF toxin-antitoxin module
MNSHIINIGNSKGVRIPKPLLEESGLGSKVEITAKRGEIKITAVIEPDQSQNTGSILSEKSLAKEWLNTDEDKAWENL